MTNNDKEKVVVEQGTTADVTKVDDTDSEDKVEFTDTSVDGSSENDSSEDDEVQTKKTQSKEENHKFAEMRRKKEQEEKDALKRDSYRKGLMEGTDGRNPYTHEKMEDDDDIEIYQNMKEIERRGGDPVEDYAKYMKIFKKEAREKEAQANKAVVDQQAQLNNNISLFKEKYPDVDLGKVLNDEEFKLFALPSINRGEPIHEAYARWLDFSARSTSQIEDKARKKVAKKLSSPGSLTNTGEEKPKSFKDMTSEEFRAYKTARGL